MRLPALRAFLVSLLQRQLRKIRKGGRANWKTALGNGVAGSAARHAPVSCDQQIHCGAGVHGKGLCECRPPKHAREGSWHHSAHSPKLETVHLSTSRSLGKQTMGYLHDRALKYALWCTRMNANHRPCVNRAGAVSPFTRSPKPGKMKPWGQETKPGRAEGGRQVLEGSLRLTGRAHGHGTFTEPVRMRPAGMAGSGVTPGSGTGLGAHVPALGGHTELCLHQVAWGIPKYHPSSALPCPSPGGW